MIIGFNKGVNKMNFDYKVCMLTNNDCYKAKKKMTPKGIVVHSTGANNPNLKRYVQPDDDILGTNSNENHWNRNGINKCVNAFIGKDKSGTIRCYQTLPWNISPWGCGNGSKGSYNYDPTGYIQFEICEDALTDENYFNSVMDCATSLCAYLCEKYNLDVSTIVSHHEAYLKGYASNHADCDHWLKKFGKDMNWFRNYVKTKLTNGNSVVSKINVGDIIKLKDGCTYYNGKTIPKWVRNSKLYYRGDNKNGAIISIFKSGSITGIVAKGNLIKV